MYRVIAKFADAQDKDYIYEVGNEYPRRGKKVSSERLEQLLSDNNGARKPVIAEVAEEKEPEMAPETSKMPQNGSEDEGKGNIQPKGKKPEKGK